MRQSPRFALVLVLGALAGTAQIGQADGLSRRERGDLAIRARAILETYCVECHKGDKPRPTLAVLDHNALIAKDPPVPFVNLLNPARSQVIEFIEDGSMPPGGRQRPTPDELASLKEWVKAQAPRFPPAFDDHTTMEVMLDDWAAQPQEDRRHLRYLSFANLVRQGRANDLAMAERRLQLALLAGCGKSIAPLEVDDTATLFRLDLRKVGWDAIDLFIRVEKEQPRPNTYPIIPYDLILLEDPHTDTELVGEKDPLAARLKEFLKTTNQLRPVPFLRGEWVAEVLARDTPLAAELRSLVDLAAARAANPNANPCGPPAHPFANAKPVTVEAHKLPPLTSWYTGDVTPHNDPFGLKVEAVLPLKGNKVTNVVELDEAFRLRVTVAERRLRFVVLKVLSTGAIGVQPVDEGDFIKPGESLLLGPPAGKPFLFPSILTGGKEETQHFVILAAEGEMPPLTFIRSRHANGQGCLDNQNPIERFVFDRTSGHEMNSIVRKVVSLKVVEKR